MFEHSEFLIELIGPPTCDECEERRPHRHLSSYEIAVPTTRWQEYQRLVRGVLNEFGYFRERVHYRVTECRRNSEKGERYEYVD